jgi:hypothetical protein
LNVKLLYNTFVGTTGGRAALVHLSNADATTMSAELDDNIIFGTSRPTLVEDTAHGKVAGQNNWIMTGADATGLSGSVAGNDPKFRNAAQNDFTPAPGSSAIGAALASIMGLPDHEYYKDETVTREYRVRASAKDIGALESATQGPGIGPGGGSATGGAGGSGGTTGVASTPTGGVTTTGGATGGVAAATGGSATSAGGAGGIVTSATTASGGLATTGGSSAKTTAAGGSTGLTDTTGATNGKSGCGCRLAGNRSPTSWGEMLALGAAVAVRFRRREVRWLE